MYNEVLKYGSFIVDALVKFEQPIFVYIPPHGELRGGSWVVVDPTINPTAMEMYADADARGGVLEPEGIIGIKYRRDKQLDTMSRLDDTYSKLKKQLENPALTAEQAAEIKAKMTTREKQLLPVYGQIATQFADLHDRAGRMKAKGTVRDQLEWINARRFFYWRLRRRINEEATLKRMAISVMSAKGSSGSKADEQLRARNLHLLESWSGIVGWSNEDQQVAEWFDRERKNISEKVDALKADKLAAEVAEVVRAQKQAGFKGVREVLRVMPVEEREAILKYLKS